MHIGIKHSFLCINIRQVPWEVLKTEAEGRSFQHLPRDLANVNALKNHAWSLLLHKNWKKHLLHFALYFALFCFAFSPNAISTDYARCRAEQCTSRNGSKSVAPVRSYWKLCSRALTAREIALLIYGFSPVYARLLITIIIAKKDSCFLNLNSFHDNDLKRAIR